jgi:late competence protein required for DNA uptake (superfamily II DNA/RNA helicase)
MWQIFVAPGDDADLLPIPNSPWHHGRWVRIPKEHWELITDFAHQLDSEKNQKLLSYSLAEDNNEDDYIYVSVPELQSIIEFMKSLSHEIENAAPLVPYATEHIPDEYGNEEHVRMLEAVVAVFQESVSRKAPFRAWIE